MEFNFSKFTLQILLMWVGLAHSSLNAFAASPMIIGDGLKYEMHGHLSVLRDPEGTLTPLDIEANYSDKFQSIKQDLALGFTSDVVWIKVCIKRATGSSQPRWWLEIAQPLFRDVTFFEKKETEYIELPKSTQNNQGSSQSTQRTPVLQLSIAPGETKEFLVRITSLTSISAEFILWNPSEFIYQHSTERFYWGAIFGMQVLIALFFGIFGFLTKERLQIIYALYILVNAVASFFSGGWPFQFFPNLSNSTFYVLLGSIVSLIPTMVAIFSIEFLQFRQPWKNHAQWVVRALVLTSIASIIMVANGANVFAMPAIQTVSVALILLILCVAIFQSTNGSANAKLYLFAFSFFYFGVTLRFLKNMGFIEPTPLNANSYQLGSFLHMLIMSVGIFLKFNKIKIEKEFVEQKLEIESTLRKEQAEFLTIISHEFRTPLSTISASSENILKDQTLSENSRERVEKIIRANQRLLNLTQQHLNQERLLSDIKSLNKKPLNLKQLIHDSISLSKDIKSRQLHVQLHDPNFQTYLDEDLMKIAITNLINNAIQYSDEESQIDLCTASTESDLQISVKNSGSQISEADLPHIFKKFYRGNNAKVGSGSGVGLFLIKSIIEKHGGRIQAHNLPAGGCEFRIILPPTLSAIE